MYDHHNSITLVIKQERGEKATREDFNNWLNGWIGELLIEDYDNLRLRHNANFEEFHIDIPINQIKPTIVQKCISLQGKLHHKHPFMACIAKSQSFKPIALIKTIDWPEVLD